MSETNEQNNQNQEQKLFAGKFKTVEELEQGYKNSAVVFDENENLKTKMVELTTIPHDYINPSDIELDASRVEDLKARAKEAGLTQVQYEKMIRSDKARVDSYKQTFENAKKEVGEETLNILKDYVTKNYPKELQESMVNTFISNKDARQAALNHRNTLLSNNIPGANKVNANNYHVSDKDVKQAYFDKEKNKNDPKAREHYLKLIAMRAEQTAS